MPGYNTMEPLLLHGHHEHMHYKNYVGLTLTQPPGAELDPGEGLQTPYFVPKLLYNLTMPSHVYFSLTICVSPLK